MPTLGCINDQEKILQVPSLSDDEKNRLLSAPLVAKLGTLSSSGDIRMTPIWFGRQPDGTFLLNTWADTGAARNVSSHPRCSLMIDQSETQPYYGVHMRGTAAVEGPENDEEGIARLFAPYKGSLEEAREYARQLIGWGKRVYIRFTPDRENTWDFR